MSGARWARCFLWLAWMGLRTVRASIYSAVVLPRLILIPGMAVDGRLFEPQREAFPDLEVPAWLAPESATESLARYGERMAAAVLKASSRGDSGRPIVVGGLSLGGMIALEMARHLGARAVAQIASCDHPSAVLPLLAACDPIGRVTPTPLLSLGKRVASLFVGRGGLPAEHRRLVVEMLRDIDIGFVRWSGRAVMAWPGVADAGAPVHHIHGTRDWVLPMSRLRTPPTQVVEGGAHVLNMSHAREVNEFLGRVLRENGA